MSERRDFVKKALLGAGAMAALPLIGNASDLHPTQDPAQPLLLPATTIKPPKLKPGDTVALCAPAGAVFSTKHIRKVQSILINMGFKVHVAESVYARYGYMAGKDAFRAAEINALFADSNIHAMIAMRGGWGCARMLDLLDYDVIQANPKVIMGFSDITSLLIAITKKTGLVTFHGPVGYSSWNDFSKRYVQKVLMQTEENVVMLNPADNKELYTIHPGIADGVLVGGNLTVLQGIMGSDYVPDWKGKILFLEETREEVYRVDRMLTTLKLAGVFDDMAGFVFGKCGHCAPEVPAESLSMEQVLKDHLNPTGKPAVFGAMIGHIANKFTLPIGINARLNASSGAIELLEPAVV